MRRSRISVSHVLLAALLLMSLLLLLTGLGWGIQPGSLRGWAIDEILPLHVITAVRGSNPGWPLRYPPFHRYLLEALFLPAWLLHKVAGFDLMAYPAYGWLFHLSRLLSVAMAVAIVFLTYRIGRELALSRRASQFAGLLVVLNPEFVYYGKTANLDVPYTFWLVLSLLFVVRILQHHRPGDYFALALAAVLAVCTKDQAYGFYVLLIPILVVEYHRHLRGRSADEESRDLPSTWKLLGAVLVTGSAVFLLVHQIPWNPGAFQRHVEVILGRASVPYQTYETTLADSLRMLLHSVRTLGFAFGWPILAVCVLGIVTALRSRPRPLPQIVLLVSLVSYYCSFVFVVRYDRDRFFLPFVPVLALFGGAWIDRFLGQRTPWWRGMAVTALCLYAAMYASSIDSLMLRDSRYGVQRWMKAHVTADATIAGVGSIQYLPLMTDWEEVAYLRSPSGAEIRERAPDYLLTTSAFARDRFEVGSEGYSFFSRLRDGSLGYRLVFTARARPGFNIMNFDTDVITNLRRISPRIEIFRRTDGRKGEETTGSSALFASPLSVP